ncbi:MAG: anthranilate phosphoribosyltransferase, partial [Nitriliruptoraceae bacterium]
AKHGNRAASGTCGSADLLEQLGVVIELDPTAAAEQLTQVGFTFLFARTYHPAVRFVATARQELRIPTVFNLLGPLANPAGAPHQTVGVANPSAAQVMIEALKSLNKRRAMVFTGSDGLDELTTTGTSLFYELCEDGQIRQGTIDPQTFGIPYATADALRGGDCADNAAIARDVLSGGRGAAHDIVALNAGAALYIAGGADTLAGGVDQARDVLVSGAAARVLEDLIAPGC